MANQTKSGRLVILAAAILAGCQATAPTPRPTDAPVPTAIATASATVPPAPTATATPKPTLPPPPVTALSDALASMNGERIVFHRQASEWPPRAFMIAPDGSGEIEIADRGSMPGVWSPDGSQLAYTGLTLDAVTDNSPTGEWARPAVINADGSGGHVLNAWTGPHNLVPLAWSADGRRIVGYGGFDAQDLADMGTFTVSAVDGGDPLKLLAAGDDTLERPDFVNVSPNGEELLVNRQLKGEDGNVFIFDAGPIAPFNHLEPAGTFSCEFPNWDFVERGGLSEAWAPHGSRVALCLFDIADDGSTLWVGSGGGNLHQIVGSDVGAISVQWSPDGQWIAFTSRWRSQPQVWVVRPDGSDLTKLTSGADGSTSVGPIWSPDGSRLLYQHMAGGGVTLWTMQADGSDQRQLTGQPIGTDYVGPYAWWPAP